MSIIFCHASCGGRRKAVRGTPLMALSALLVLVLSSCALGPGAVPYIDYTLPRGSVGAGDIHALGGEWAW